MGNAALLSSQLDFDAASPSALRVEAAAHGDRAAAQELTLELMPRVRNLVRYLTRSSDIDDVTQEALVAILRSLPGYRPIGSFQAWIDRIVVRVTYAELRRRRRGARDESIEVEEISAPSPDFATRYVTRTRIAAALDSLPVDQRFAVVLHHVLGMSAAEIAEEMHVPLETIRSRMRVGMQQLRRLMLDANEGDSR
ncbi:MAG: polymerase sigma-70 factor [Labilithrix sp.]|nr:polymerase sigma-70 factor [Labilithrix sp.]